MTTEGALAVKVGAPGFCVTITVCITCQLGLGDLLGWVADVRRRASGLGCRRRRRGDRQAGTSTGDARRTVLGDECGKKMAITLVLSGSCIRGIYRSGGSDGDCICRRSGSVGLVKCSDRLLALVPYTVTGKRSMTTVIAVLVGQSGGICRTNEFSPTNGYGG